MSDATLYYLYVGLSLVAIAAAGFFILRFRRLFLRLRGKPNTLSQEQGSTSDARPSGQAGIINLPLSLALGFMAISLFLNPFNKDLVFPGVALSILALIYLGLALFIALNSRSFRYHLEQPGARKAFGTSILFGVLALLLGLAVVFFISNIFITVVMIIITLASFGLCILFSYKALRANMRERTPSDRDR